MSLQQMQSAMAMLIRLPMHNRGEDLDGFLNQYNLEPKEISQLRILAQDPRLVKYARAMEGVREEAIVSAMRFATIFIPVDAFEYVQRNYFAPAATKIAFGEIPPRFLEFILENAEARQFLEKASPPFLFDLVRFDSERIRFRYELRPESCHAPEGSLLAHTAFRVLKFDYDVAGFMQSVAAQTPEEIAKRAPERRPVTLLLLPKSEDRGCRYFEIDETVEKFLEWQKSSPSMSYELPESYDQLVKMGLCRPLN